MKVRLILCILAIAGLLLSAAPAPGQPAFQSPEMTPPHRPTPTATVGEQIDDYSVGLDTGQVAVVWCNSNLDLLMPDRFPGGLRVTCVALDNRAYLPAVAGYGPEATATPRPTRTSTPRSTPVDSASPPTRTPTISTAMP